MIDVTPSSNNTTVKNIFNQNTTVRVEPGCTIEYNMNSMIPGLTATYSGSLETFYLKDPTGRVNVFKKLFPIDAIIKPNRPESAGIKYYILSPVDTTANSFSSYRTLSYPSNQPRIYYPGVSTAYKYWITPKDKNVDLTVTYKQTVSTGGNKHALCNKIVVKFEKYHSLPSNYTITVVPETGSNIVIGPITSVPSSGIITHYYNGTNFNTTTEPISYSQPVSIKSINLTATNQGGGRYIGVIEVSARWIKDISDDIVSLDINKESSNDTEDIVPVGFITANYLDLSLSKYNQSELLYEYYSKESTSFSANKIYLVKGAELKPHFKVRHSGASYVSGQYDLIKQGVFYIDTFSKSQYGDVSISALDGAKNLMETTIPDILCEDYPVTAIIRRILDSVGFTNYNFNLNAFTETSIPQIPYWWSDDRDTVWQALQELCRDIQMNALFDENGVLQFYSRDYLYSKSTVDWAFYHSQEGSILPNIISFEDKAIVGANQVKVLWQAPITSDYLGNSDALWQSGPSYLTAGGLKYAVASSATVSYLNDLSNDGLVIDTKTIDEFNVQQSIYNFSGYLMINSEIIEYDAIQYQYTEKDAADNAAPQLFWAESSADVNKYRYLSKVGFKDINKPETAYFRPTGRYRVKARGALGTKAEFHRATGSELTSKWTGRKVELK